ncbi:uncharacterized protein [Spinacia oleracea]|uniref:Reverse transcriptase zinc-binding domain-containing protein n=1 Tax=Spinacia oleracea TaxID=3562 RepID=A0A9R0JK70_SPIOL|nr:uncharacterized protein LOC110777343 [Spinacia oleracea]
MNGRFSIKSMYQKLLGSHEKVNWRRLICNNKATPKSLIITWLTLWGRLPTLDRLFTWKVVSTNVCPLCANCPESVQHLFFECSYSADIWQKVLVALQFSRTPSTFDLELRWMISVAKRTSARCKLLMMFFAECIYSIWLQRNAKVFTQTCLSPADVLKEIKFRVACKATDDQKQLLLF